MNTKQRKDPWFAVCLSRLVPGLGQIYAKKIIIGIIFLFAVCFFLATTVYLIFISNISIFWGLISMVLLIFVVIWNLFNAYKLTKHYNLTLTPEVLNVKDSSGIKTKKPWLAVFLSSFIPGLGQMYCKKWVKGIIFLIGIFVLWSLEKSYWWIYFIEGGYIALVMYEAWLSAQGLQKLPKKAIIIFCLVATGLSMLPHHMYIDHMVEFCKYLSSSMEPTIMAGDRIMVEKITYKFSESQRGDVISFKWPENPQKVFIMRIIAKGEDTVEIKIDGKIYVNGKPLTLKQFDKVSYDRGNYAVNGQSYAVPSNHYFVLGDNHFNSKDSRYWGALPRENIIGRAYKICWPLNRTGKIQ